MQIMVLPYLVLTLVVGLGQLGLRAMRAGSRGAGVLIAVSCALGLLVVGVMPIAFPALESASFFSHALLEPRKPFALAELYVPAKPVPRAGKTPSCPRSCCSVPRSASR